jgi:hypothetical protein
MDIFNQPAKRFENGGAEPELRQQITDAYATDLHTTPANLLLDRLLMQAEATPQLAPTHDFDAKGYTTADEHCPAAGQIAPPTTAGRAGHHRNILARFFDSSDSADTPVQDKLQRLRDLNWELYHEYLEQHFNCGNATSGVNL